MNNVHRLDLTPKFKRPLSWKNPLHYLLLLYWVFFFPQAIKWYIEQYINLSEIKELKTFKEKFQYLFKYPVLRELILQSFILIILPLLIILPNFFSGQLILDSQFISDQEIDFNSKNLIFILQKLWLTIQKLPNELWSTLKVLLTNNIFISIGSGILFFLLGFYDLELSSGIVVGITLSLLLSIMPHNEFTIYITFALLTIGSSISSKKKENILFSFPGPLFGLSTGFLLGITIGLINLINILLTFLKNGILQSAFSLAGTVFLILFFILFFTIIWAIFYMRLENWLVWLPLNLLAKNKFTFLPHATLIPIPGLYYQIIQDLKKDWEIGLDNINELLKYTMQILPAFVAIYKILDKTSGEQLFKYVNKLINKIHNFELIYLYTKPLNFLIQDFFFFGLLSTLRMLVNNIYFILYIFSNKSLTVDKFNDMADETFNNFIVCLKENLFKINTKNIYQNKIFINYKSQHFIASGFWSLYKKVPEKAKEVFSSVKHLPHGQELFLIADIFSNLTSNHDYLNYIISVELPKEELIRQDTWKVIKQLQKIAQDILLIEKSLSLVNRSLASNRAIGSIEQILNNKDDLPELEKGMIIDILEFWKKNLLQNASKIGDDSTLKPSIQPYVIGDPVQNQIFVGRTDIIKRLEKIWLCSNQIQSVILYGHRRMGKTSILINISDQLGSKVKLAYINLNGLGDIAGVDEVFMAITDAISEILNIAPPNDQDLIQSPYRTFKRYLKQITQNNLTEYNLIIALDEFETLENLIQAKKISSEFLGFLRSMMQLSPKIAFAFAGLHTLDEMTADYFQPFFASIIPIRVNFLSEGATGQLLANPNDEFLLDYQPEALDLIYQLTSGQPYLVQLIGFYLVGHYNDQFEMGKPRDPILTTEDVNAIINHSEFFKNGRYYFTGVWGQASQNAPAQQEILRAIAPYPQGLDIRSIEAITGIDQTTLEIALKTLERHDVIQEKTGRWSIIVELFRRWVEQEKTSNS